MTKKKLSIHSKKSARKSTKKSGRRSREPKKSDDSVSSPTLPTLDLSERNSDFDGVDSDEEIGVQSPKQDAASMSQTVSEERPPGSPLVPQRKYL